MAKTITCGCGGEYEDTPSRRSRHNQTNRHVGYVASQQKAAKATATTTSSKVAPAASSAEGDTPSRKVSKAQVVRDLLISKPNETLSVIAKEANVSYEYAWDIKKAAEKASQKSA